MKPSTLKLSDPNIVDQTKNNSLVKPSKLNVTPSRVTSLQSRDKENEDPSVPLDGTPKNLSHSSKKFTPFKHASPSLKLQTTDSQASNGLRKTAIHHRPTPSILFGTRPFPTIRSSENENTNSPQGILNQNDPPKRLSFTQKRSASKKQPIACKMKLTSINEQQHDDVPSHLFKVVPDNQSFPCCKPSSKGRILPKIAIEEKEEKPLCHLQTIEEDDEVLSDQVLRHLC